MDLADLADLRHEYQAAGLVESDLDPDPIAQFATWFGEWRAIGVGEPNAMVLATATPDGRPSARTVLLKGVVDGAFRFFTNYESRKGRELATNPWATLLFSWHPVNRQITIEGRVQRVGADVSDAYWASRPFGSRLGAAASPQSSPVADRAELDRRFAAVAAAHPDGEIPRPDHWGGYAVVPDRIEFWQGRENRVHDRLCYRRTSPPRAPATWVLERLAP